MKRRVRLQRPLVVLRLVARVAKERDYWPSTTDVAAFGRAHNPNISAGSARKWLGRLSKAGLVESRGKYSSTVWVITPEGWAWSGLEPVTPSRARKPRARSQATYDRRHEAKKTQALADAYRVFEDKPEDAQTPPWTPPAPEPPPAWLQNLPSTD